MRYVLDFGSANAGSHPTFMFFVRLDTLEALTQPTFYEISNGLFYFDWDWDTIRPAGTSLAFKASASGVELADVLSSTSGLPGSTNPTYVLDFGSANAGGSPTFLVFARLDTLAALTQPTIAELGSGEYLFTYDWATAPSGVSSIAFKATLNGTELSDVLSTPTSSVAGYDSAGTIINDAATECGLAAVSDPYAETDANFVKLRGLLKSFGRDLAREREWSHLQKEYTFSTVQGQSAYALPSDFHTMIPQTGWNRTTRFPLGGPASPQEWQYLSARLVGVVFRTIFRRQQGQFNIYPAAGTNIAGGQTIAFEYMSYYWAGSATSTGPEKDYPDASTDLVWFEPGLMVAGLKWKFLRTNGLAGATEAGEDYLAVLAKAQGADSRARTLNMAGQADSFPLIGPMSFPITGYGQ